MRSIISILKSGGNLVSGIVELGNLDGDGTKIINIAAAEDIRGLALTDHHTLPRAVHLKPFKRKI